MEPGWTFKIANTEWNRQWPAMLDLEHFMPASALDWSQTPEGWERYMTDAGTRDIQRVGDWSLFRQKVPNIPPIGFNPGAPTTNIPGSGTPIGQLLPPIGGTDDPPIHSFVPGPGIAPPSAGASGFLQSHKRLILAAAAFYFFVWK